MKKLLITVVGVFLLSVLQSQMIYDFKVKNNFNAKDRTMMLDIYRAKLYSDYRQEFLFVVNHFKMGNNYAWFMADIQRSDGRSVRMPQDGGEYDCCHVEALFKKSRDKWFIVESGEFSTDVWWEGISRRYPQAPRLIFDAAGR